MQQRRFFGNVYVNYADEAFWVDVLTRLLRLHRLLHDAERDLRHEVATASVTSLKGNNILNEKIQQHVFGDILKRSFTGEVRFKF